MGRKEVEYGPSGPRDDGEAAAAVEYMAKQRGLREKARLQH